MLDYRFIKDNLAAVKRNIADRNMRADADRVAELYDKRTALVTELQGLQQKRNENAKAIKAGAVVGAATGVVLKNIIEPQSKNKGSDFIAATFGAGIGALITAGKDFKNEISSCEDALKQAEADLEEAARQIPNMAHPEAPVGAADSDSLEVKRVGEPRAFAFAPKDHVALGEALDIIDFDRAAKVSGNKFYYLKNEAVFLEMALVQYGLNVLRKHGFTPFVTPDVAREEILQGIGFNPRGSESNVYALEGEHACLVATAEITLGGYHAGEILAKDSLPRYYCGLSHCFRREAGAAGQFSRGLYRVHQFSKLEMFVYCLPEQSDAIHEKIRLIEEEIFAGLGIPFRVVDTCTGDLGAPAYRKWDLEAWMPGRNGGEWGEVTSASNCTDYQARRLNVRYKDGDGRNKFVHMLNGTAVAVSRALVAILENCQNEDGSVSVPPALIPYCGFDKIEPRR